MCILLVFVPVFVNVRVTVHVNLYTLVLIAKGFSGDLLQLHNV